jgi:hypothetical protein
LISSIEDQFINTEEENKNLQYMKEQQFMGDIHDYILKIQDLNYRVCLPGIA